MQIGFNERKLIEIDAADLFEDENIDWHYCVDHSTFLHKDPDACEFILYLSNDTEVFVTATLKHMTEYGCTPEFIEAIKLAHTKGAEFVLLYI